MKARIIQYRFGPDAADVDANFNWIISELGACDDSIDIVVLPEGSHDPAPTGAGSLKNAECAIHNAKARNEKLLAKASETARRCRAAVFGNARFDSPTGPRNSTFAYAPDGTFAARYDKQNLTPGEHKTLDDSYTREWNAPVVAEIAGSFHEV